MFYEAERFAFPPLIEAEWQAIRAEYEAIRAEVIDWRGVKLYKTGWKVFGLHDFPDGAPIEENIAKCPRTAAVIKRCFPQHGVVGFSVLQPGTEVFPHEGSDSPYLRCHLGLIVPPGECALSVGKESRNWSEGRVLVFDDHAMHAAWNRTPCERVILLIDFVPDPSTGIIPISAASKT